MSSLNFFYEDVDSDVPIADSIKAWIKDIITSHNFKLVVLNYIICSDNYLLNINQTYLSHDYLTDIITFDNSDNSHDIEADIFISIERVMDNAQQLEIHWEKEFQRVLAHGLLHLMGWNDKTNEEKRLMREKEEACLSLLEI